MNASLCRASLGVLLTSFALFACGDGDSEPVGTGESSTSARRPAQTFSAELPSEEIGVVDPDPGVVDEEASLGNDAVPAPDFTPEQMKSE